MRKKFTMLLASLFLVMGTAWADNVRFDAESTSALPGTLTDGQYTWKSSNMAAPDGFTTLRLTFLENVGNGADNGGFPHVNLAEFYLYDNTGTSVTLTADKFSSNATETNEGKSGLHRLCDGTFAKLESDGVNDWYWHSYWSANAGAYHYLEINVADIANLSTFAVGYVSRQSDGTPTEILVTTGSSTADVAAQYNSYMLFSGYDLSTQAFRVKNSNITNEERFLTIETPNLNNRDEDGVKILSKSYGDESEAQAWKFIPQDDGTYRIQSASGYFLNNHGSWGINAEDGTQGHELDNPKFTLEYLKDGEFRIKSVSGYVGPNDPYATGDHPYEMFGNHTTKNKYLDWTLESYTKEYTITCEYIFGGKTVHTTSSPCVAGETYSISNPYQFAAIASCLKNEEELPANEDGAYSFTATEHANITVVLENNLPFTPTTITEEGTFADNTVWYVIRQNSTAADTRTWKYDNGLSTEKSEAYSDNHLWCFVGDLFDLKIYNKVAGSSVSLTSSTAPATMAEDATGWVIVGSNDEKSFAGKNPFCLERKNNAGSYLNGASFGYWTSKDAGSTLRVVSVEEAISSAAAAKSAALENLVSLNAINEEADYYNFSTAAFAAAKATIKSAAITAFADIAPLHQTINNAMSTLMATSKITGAPVAGDYIQLKNKQHNKYLKGFDTYAEGADSKAEMATVWAVKEGADGVKLQNMSTGKYIGRIRRSATATMTNEADAAEFSWTNQESVYAVFKDVNTEGVAEGDLNYLYGHVNGGKLVGWEPVSGSTQWLVSKVDMDAPTLTNLAQLSEDKVYTLRSKRAFLFYRSESSTVCSSTGTAVGSVVYDRDEPNQQFMFKKEDGNYYLYSVGAGKYVKKDGTYAETIDGAHALSFADKSANRPEYPWQLALDGYELNSQNGGQNAAGIMFSNYDTADDGNCYKIEVGNVYVLHVLGEGVENVAVTIKDKAYKNGSTIAKTDQAIEKADITAPAIAGKVTVINIESGDIYVSYIDESTQYYTIKGGHGGYMSLAEAYVDADKNLCMDVKSRVKDKQGLWTFVAQEGGGYKIYNYSTGWSKAVGMTNNGDARARMVAPDADYTTFDGNINFDGTVSHIKLKGTANNYWNRNGDRRYLSLWNNSAATNNDKGSQFFMNAVASVNDFVDVAKPIIPETREELAADKIQGIAEFTPDHANTLWYKTSAMAAGVNNPWMEYALPLGNGELGCMVYGGVLKEEIQFNEKTLWNGPTNAFNVGSGNRTYMNFGSLFIKNLDASINENGVTDYVRYLDIEEGVAGVKFTANGTKHSRKYFSSAPDQVIAGQYKIEEGDGKLNLRFTLEAETEIDADYIIYKEGMASFTGYMESVNYAARVHVKVSGEGATITTTEEGIVVGNATEVTFFLKGATNFNGSMDAIDSYFTSDTPAQVNASVKSAIEKAAEKDFATIETAHREDFKKLTGSMTFSLGLTAPEMDTKELVDNYFPNNGNGTSTENDHLFLEQLYFHYGRYLAISSNRQPIAAPNNLQGLWNDRASGSPWNSDIHTNINIQMNYWPTEITNLSDLHKPFVNYIIRGAQTEGWKNVSKQYNNDGPGWGILTETSLYGAMSNFKTNYLVANVWYTSHLWQHYRYTQDVDFLKKAFPAMWGAAEFWMHRLIKDRVANDGTWVAPDEYSAEQDWHASEDATAHAQQMVSYLFQNIIDAIEILGEENVNLTSEQIANIRQYNKDIDKGLHTEVYDGAWGATYNGVKTGDLLLREWKYSPYSVGQKEHRHLSHLMALFPMDQITPESEYFIPAVNALKQRGDAATGWSMGWKTNLWARAQDGDHAHLIIKNALKHSTSYGTDGGAGGIYYNLFDSHAPFQIDGNFGVCSGMAEMLMQSAHGYINILPALPTVWEAQGEVTGMKAIGNFTVDFNWENGKAQQVTIVSNAGAELKVRCKRGAMDIAKAKITVNGVEVNVTEVENGIATIPCNEGETVVIDFTTIKTVAYTVSGGTGTFNNDNANSKWEHVWTFNKNEAQPAPLQFTTTQNNMDSEAAENNMLIAPGNLGATYTLKVPFPFLIKGYSFHCDGPDGGNQKIVIGTNEYPVKDGADIEVTGLSAQQAQFTLSGNNASVEVTDFKVYITTDPSFEYADSYENITQWYYIQMNPADATYGQKYVNYNVSGNGELSADRNKPAEGSTKAYAWAFVGNPFDGFKVYNRAAGGDVAVHSTGTGPLTMEAGGTAFMMDASSNTGDGYFCFKTPSNNYWNLNGNKVQHYGQNDGGSTILLDAIEDDAAVVTARETALEQVIAKANTLGTTLGYYTYTAGGKKLYTLDAVRIALRDADTEAEITNLLNSYSINMPVSGQFIRVKNNGGSGYLDGNGTSGRTLFTAGIGNGANSVFYFVDDKLLSYKTGFYLAAKIPSGKSANFLCYTETIGEGTGITFKASPAAGKYCIGFDNDSRGLYSAGANESDAAGANNTGDNYRFTVEEVTSLPFTISSVGYGTLWAPVALEIPEHVKAYTGVVEGNYLVLTKITTGIIPAETGVVIYRDGESYDVAPTEATTHDFKIVANPESSVTNRRFSGGAATIASTTATNPYTLQTHGDGVAFKKFTGENIPSFKAYLEFESAQQAQALRIRFAGEQDEDDNQGGDATEVEMSIANGQQPTAIYDLQGRRVLNPTKGVYIVNGKKVLF